jgi:hypothetical protein
MHMHPGALCLLQATLFPTNPMLHPGIMYSFWSRWDGTPLTERPVFYEGMCFTWLFNACCAVVCVITSITAAWWPCFGIAKLHKQMQSAVHHALWPCPAVVGVFHAQVLTVHKPVVQGLELCLMHAHRHVSVSTLLL